MKAALENHQNKLIVAFLTVAFLTIALFISTAILKTKNQQVLGANNQGVVIKEDEDFQLNYWLNLAESNPNYQTAWIKIGQIAQEKQDTFLLTKAIEKLKTINPNLDEIAVFEKNLP